MDVEALNTFLAVCRERSFTNAARRLHRTQPAISQRILQLEEQLGAPLFERASSGVVLSQAGRALLPYAERALGAIKDAEHAVRALTLGDAGSVNLATVGTLAGPGLVAALKQFALKHPRVDVSLQTARSAKVSELVRRGDATIGLRYDRDRSPDLQCELVGVEKLTVVCAPQHRLAGRSISALRTLRDERWIAFPDIPEEREVAASHIFGIFQTRGLGEIDWTPVDSLTAQKRLVEAGFGLALMTESSIAEERAAGAIATIGAQDLGAGTPVFVITRAGGFLSGAARQLFDLLRAGSLLETRPAGALARARRASGKQRRQRTRHSHK